MSERRPIVAGLLLTLICLAAGGCANPQLPVDTLRSRGDMAFARGDYAAAQAEYQEIAYRYPGDWQAQYRLGLCLLQLDHPSDARSALEIAHARRPDDDAINDALAEAMFRSGDEKALFAFLHERTTKSGAVADYVRLGRYALETGDPDAARRAIDTAIALDDGRSVGPYLLAADLAQRTGDRALEKRRLQQAYGIDPDDEAVAQRLRGLGEVPGPTIALPPGR